MIEESVIGDGLIRIRTDDLTEGLVSVEIVTRSFGVAVEVAQGALVTHQKVIISTWRNSRIVHYFPEGYPALKDLSMSMFIVP